MKTLPLALLLLNTLSVAFADDDFSKIEYKATPLTASLYMLEGAGGNITASIGTDGVLLVDDDFAEMSNKLVAKLKELGGNTPKFIINTHFHYDHTGGNENFAKTATIISTPEVRNRLMTEQTLWGAKHAPVSVEFLPNLTFEGSLTLNLNNDNVRVIHPLHGHTDGDSIVFFENSKVVSLGDLYFSGMYPIFHTEHDGNLEGFVEDIKMVLKQIPDDTKIVSGHGPLSTKAELQVYCNMIETSIAKVKDGIQKNLSLVEIQKIGLPSETEPFSHGYITTDQWIKLLYKSLKK